MREYAIAGLLLVSLTVPAFATTVAMLDAGDTTPNYSYAAKDHWAVDDTVGNCAVIDSKPNTTISVAWRFSVITAATRASLPPRRKSSQIAAPARASSQERRLV